MVEFKVLIHKDKCKGCGLCIFYCPLNHLEQSDCLNKRGVKFAVENKKNSCIGCKACFFICPEACIEVYEAKKKK